jgi:hypothetical protein
MLLLTLGAVRTLHAFRGRAMRGLAAKLGFQYIGPPAPPTWWWNPPFKMGSPPVGTSHFHPPEFAIRQVWNVIEGERNGAAVIIFDGIMGAKGGEPCTFIACKSEQDPFAADTLRETVVQSRGWAVLCGVWFLWFSWTMSTRRIEDLVDCLRPWQKTSFADMQSSIQPAPGAAIF